MATAAQLIANRLNARRSTGPKTDEGKTISRQNAATHGLSANLVDLVIDPSQFDEEKAYWSQQFKPVGPVQESLFSQVVIDSIRIKRCQETYFAKCDEFGNRAALQWDQDRFCAAEHLFLAIHKMPAVITRDLENTPHGALVKIKAWTGLLSSLKAHKIWTDPQRTLALDLLGCGDHQRDAETPFDPQEGDVYETRVEVVEEEIARLEQLVSGPLAQIDAYDQSRAARGIGAELTKPLQMIDRYERAALKRRTVAITLLKSPPPALSEPAETATDDEDLDHEEPALSYEKLGELIEELESEPSFAFEEETEDDDEIESDLEPVVPVATAPASKGKRGSTKRLNRRQRRALAAGHKVD